MYLRGQYPEIGDGARETAGTTEDQESLSSMEEDDQLHAPAPETEDQRDDDVDVLAGTNGHATLPNGVEMEEHYYESADESQPQTLIAHAMWDMKRNGSCWPL